MRLLLVTGPGGDAQGWGDMKVTHAVAGAAESWGHSARIAHVESEADFLKALDEGGFDMVWSALYHISPNEKFIGRNEEGMWVADVLDERGIPYIGSDSRSMKAMIDKFQTHTVLARHGVPVPGHHLVHEGDDLSVIPYPAFVKPMCESRSVGISDDSVVFSEEELRRQVAYIQREFNEAALVEDFMPGDEYTVLVLGNGETRECLAGMVTVEPQHYGRHKILRSDLRGVGLTHVGPPGPRGEEAGRIAAAAAEAMNCLDHIRIDVKTDAAGQLRIMEVNGIPGLKPGKSWTPQLYTLYHGSPEGPIEDHRRLIARIIDEAGRRYGMPTHTFV
ncbi:MAG: ATP-grasp domain-containing protein [Vicinamibacterales bacterium]